MHDAHHPSVSIAHTSALPGGRLLEPATIAGRSLRNRLAVAPMSRVSAGDDGRPTARMARYYALFAEGGFGLVITEGLYTDSRMPERTRGNPV